MADKDLNYIKINGDTYLPKDSVARESIDELRTMIWNMSQSGSSDPAIAQKLTEMEGLVNSAVQVMTSTIRQLPLSYRWDFRDDTYGGSGSWFITKRLEDIEFSIEWSGVITGGTKGSNGNIYGQLFRANAFTIPIPQLAWGESDTDLMLESIQNWGSDVPLIEISDKWQFGFDVLPYKSKHDDVETTIYISGRLKLYQPNMLDSEGNIQGV